MNSGDVTHRRGLPIENHRLQTRLRDYALARHVEFADYDERFELYWHAGVKRRFIEIDKHTLVVRTGFTDAARSALSLEYSAPPARLGSEPLEELLDGLLRRS